MPAEHPNIVAHARVSDAPASDVLAAVAAGCHTASDVAAAVPMTVPEAAEHLEQLHLDRDVTQPTPGMFYLDAEKLARLYGCTVDHLRRTNPDQ